MTRKTKIVAVGNVKIGGGGPVIVQSMTDSITSNITASVEQVMQLADAGSEIVRLTVNDEEAASAIPQIKNILLQKNYTTPLVGCFHYNGHSLLSGSAELCDALDKYRINPGNVGFGQKHDLHFETIIKLAIKHNKPIRIGVNWGSLDQALSAKLMDENAKLIQPQTAEKVLQEALILSALNSAQQAEKLGLASDKIIISCKISRVPNLIATYRELSKRCDYPLHLGLTEAGMGKKGIISSAVALSPLLLEGIGDTIRVSLTPGPNDARVNEVYACNQILQSLELRHFEPQVTSCPGCGRTSSSYFRTLADDIQNYIRTSMKSWRSQYPGVENMNIAVMGCIVNGPGESKHANIGISLPGTGENPIAPVFTDGVKTHTLRGDNIGDEFKILLLDYIRKNFKE